MLPKHSEPSKGCAQRFSPIVSAMLPEEVNKKVRLFDPTYRRLEHTWSVIPGLVEEAIETIIPHKQETTSW